MTWRRFYAVLVARNKEFIRDRAFLGWTIMFPVVIVFGFAFAFSEQAQDEFKVGVYGERAGHPFFATRYVQFIEVSDLAAALRKVERHQLHMLLDAAQGRYWINSESPDGYLVEQLLRASRAGPDPGFTRQSVSGREVRYVDWLLPGLLCMNMMWAALWGVGFVIVRYRKNGVLRRLKATPLTPLEFIAAQLASRLAIILVITTIIFFGSDRIVDFVMHGSYLLLLLVFTLGTVCLIAMGLVVAARGANEELAGGILNLVSWPMMFLSGVWFSVEGLHSWVQVSAQLLPLTHVIDAARAIMIDGAGLLDVAPQIGVLVLMTAVFLALGALAFRWE